MNETKISLHEVPVNRLAEIIEIVEKGEVSFSNASSKIITGNY